MASPVRATTAPATTSRVQWWAVATTAKAMAIGMRTPATRTTERDEICIQLHPTSRFHPRCRLGTAANLLTRVGGCRTRYEIDRAVTESMYSAPKSRGGVTAIVAKITSPMAPEMNMAFRSSKNVLRW